MADELWVESERPRPTAEQVREFRANWFTSRNEAIGCVHRIFDAAHALAREVSALTAERDQARAERDAAQDAAAQAIADFDRVVRERNEARAMLARIYVESGGDTDGNDPTTPDGIERLWRQAEAGVRELREGYDAMIAEVDLTAKPAGVSE